MNTRYKGATYTIQSKADDFPDILRHIPDPPRQLYVQCHNWTALLGRDCVAVVGSRKATPYGKIVTAEITSALANAGLVIVSGLAFGIDAIAHRVTLERGGLTIAVLASGLEDIYPGVHRQLAERIVAQGGALISEYPAGSPSYRSNFVARNRLVSGLSRAVLITEAAEKSGTLHTARFALEQGREVFAVPGNITSPTAAGTNNLIKSGATPVTTAGDVLHTLGCQTPLKATAQGNTPDEQAIIDALLAGETDGTVILQQSGLMVRNFNQALTMLEISGTIQALGANQWTLRPQ